MNRLAILLSAAFAILAPTPSLAIEGGRYGDVHLVVPDDQIQGYVVLFSDQNGWSDVNQSGACGAWAAGGTRGRRGHQDLSGQALGRKGALP